MKDDFIEDSQANNWRRNALNRVEENLANIFIFLVLLLIFLICIYRIFATRNYDLKYTYYVAVISLYMIILTFTFKNAIKQIEEREQKGKKHNRKIVFLSSIVSLITLSISLYSFISINFTPEKIISLKDLSVPQEIWISKISDSNYFTEPDIDFLDKKDNEISIQSPEDIGQIIEDLEYKEVRNLSTIEVFNFIRMKADNTAHYSLYFDHENYYRGEVGLDKGYIWSITITSNNKIVIEERYYNYDNLLVGGERAAYYPVSFSNKTMELINSYIK